MALEDGQPGQTVRVTLEPGCEGEFVVHGIFPRVDGLTGIILAVAPDDPLGQGYKPDHIYRVHLAAAQRGPYQWFKPTELSPLEKEATT